VVKFDWMKNEPTGFKVIKPKTGGAFFVSKWLGD
jgi:hypothetical protein